MGTLQIFTNRKAVLRYTSGIVLGLCVLTLGQYGVHSKWYQHLGAYVLDTFVLLCIFMIPFGLLSVYVRRAWVRSCTGWALIKAGGLGFLWVSGWHIVVSMAALYLFPALHARALADFTQALEWDLMLSVKDRVQLLHTFSYRLYFFCAKQTLGTDLLLGVPALLLSAVYYRKRAATYGKV